jgi:uncharacterized Zn-binding protein involved in type VI secretion
MMGFPAARLTDLTSHISLVGAMCGVIGALPLPSAAMAGAMAGAMALQIPTGVVTAPCFPPVIVGFLPSARVLDLHACSIDLPLPNTITTGSSTVLIGGLPAARISDKTFCSAEVSTGMPNVLIGGPVVVFPINIHGDIAFVKNVQQSMATLYGTPSGKAILAGIAGKNNTVTIVPTNAQNGYCGATNQADSMNPAKGSSSTVSWNPSYSIPSDPTSTPTIVLGHELVHAYHNGTGTAKNGPHDSYAGQTGTSDRGEERATVGCGGTSVVTPAGTPAVVPDHSADVPTENSIRDDLGVARRPTYYPSNWPGGPPW